MGTELKRPKDPSEKARKVKEKLKAESKDDPYVRGFGLSEHNGKVCVVVFLENNNAKGRKTSMDGVEIIYSAELE